MGTATRLRAGAQERERGAAKGQPGHLGLQVKSGGDGEAGQSGPKLPRPEHHGRLAQGA